MQSSSQITYIFLVNFSIFSICYNIILGLFRGQTGNEQKVYYDILNRRRCINTKKMSNIHVNNTHSIQANTLSEICECNTLCTCRPFKSKLKWSGNDTSLLCCVKISESEGSNIVQLNQTMIYLNSSYFGCRSFICVYMDIKQRLFEHCFH